MGVKTLINKFTTGELDPKFLGEVDYEGYRKGARKLRNVICTPQGAAIKRFGTIYDATLQNGAAFITNPNECKLIPFEYLSAEIYWIVIRASTANTVAMDIYLDDDMDSAPIFTLDPLGTYTTAHIRQIRWVADVNKLILLTGDLPIHLVQRIASNNWTQTDAVLSYFPADDFASQDNPTNNYTNNGTTFTPNAIAATTVTASMPTFTSNHAGIPPNKGGYITGNGGIFRIVSVDATGTIATGTIINDFINTTAIPGPEVFVGERAWGDGAVIGVAPPGLPRGFPRHGAFFQSRLVLGGSPSSPGSVYASETKDFFNFNNAQAEEASGGWGIEAGVTGTDVVQDILSTKSLILLTNKGTAATSILIDTPTTPTNVFLNTQGLESSRNMDATIVNNQVLYADRAGNTIWTMVYDVPDTGYSVFNASILSSHLIRNPVWADVYDPDLVDGRYYLLVNEDGSLAIYNTIIEENIKAWILAEITGRFIDVACIANQAKVLVERQVGTGATIDGYALAYYKVDETFNAFRNITPAVLANTTLQIFELDEDYLLIGNEIPFTALRFLLPTPASEDLDLFIEFLTNTGDWEELVLTTDTTNGLTITGNMTWEIEDVSNWEARVLPKIDLLRGDPVKYYWLRLKRTNDNDLTPPSEQTIKINIENRINMEEIDFDLIMDATTITTSDDTGLITGLDHLAGQVVFVFANRFPIKSFYVMADGTIQTDIPDALIELGIDTPPTIVPMPVVTLMQTGYGVYDPVHINSIYIDYLDTNGLVIQTQNVPQVVPGNFLTDQIPVPDTGYYEVAGFGGWDPRVDVVITQSYPAKMTIRGIQYDVEVS